MAITGRDSLKTRRTLTVKGQEFDYFSLKAAEETLGDVSRLEHADPTAAVLLAKHEHTAEGQVADPQIVIRCWLSLEADTPSSARLSVGMKCNAHLVRDQTDRGCGRLAAVDVVEEESRLGSADVAGQLMEHQKNIRELTGQKNQAPKTQTTNILFTGSTKDLQMLLKGNLDEIDITPEED